ncbi:hypothetical protein TNCV_3724191 [Trichonephila clavipes]|nr:hypothetical protein TNCV_3724191 [Trichonephila clavipes]
MARRKGLSADEIANLLREISEKEANGGELSCFNLDSNEDIRLSESTTVKILKELQILLIVFQYILIYMSQGRAQNGYHIIDLQTGRFAIQNVLRQSSGPADFAKHNVNVSFL